MNFSEALIVPLLVLGYRVLIPFTILRWPLGGLLLSIVADASDVVVMQLVGWGVFAGRAYTPWDKVLDLWYLFFAWHAVRKFWKEPLARTVAQTLFWWRAAGVTLFFLIPSRLVFVFFPNIFENFYILWTAIRTWRPTFGEHAARTRSIFATLILIAATPKIIQEALMHWLFENRTWEFFRTFLFWWLYR